MNKEDKEFLKSIKEIRQCMIGMTTCMVNKFIRENGQTLIEECKQKMFEIIGIPKERLNHY